VFTLAQRRTRNESKLRYLLALWALQFPNCVSVTCGAPCLSFSNAIGERLVGPGPAEQQK
jgi:hypothetical protein